MVTSIATNTQRVFAGVYPIIMKRKIFFRESSHKRYSQFLGLSEYADTYLYERDLSEAWQQDHFPLTSNSVKPELYRQLYGS